MVQVGEYIFGTNLSCCLCKLSGSIPAIKRLMKSELLAENHKLMAIFSH